MWPIAFPCILIDLDLLLLLSLLIWFFLPLFQGILLLVTCKFALCKGFVSHAQTNASDIFLLLFLSNQIAVWVFFKETFNTVEVLIGF